MSSERVYQIAVSNNKLLRRKIALCVFPDELHWLGLWRPSRSHAPPRGLLEDWRVQEAAINAELPRFTRDIKVDGFGALDIHYVHQKSKTVDAIPLYIYLYMSGRAVSGGSQDASPSLSWDSKFPRRCAESSGLLVFFSEAPSKKGFRVNQYAEVSHKVMMALSYSEYVTHGGDLGTMITRAMALKYGSKHVEAWHTSLP